MKQHGQTENLAPLNEQVALNKLFFALSDPTRRAILKDLKDGEASVRDLAKPFAMSQPAISKHLKILGDAGLVDRIAHKQMRLARLNTEPLANAVSWLEEFQEFWSSSLDQLDELLDEIKPPSAKSKISK